MAAHSHGGSQAFAQQQGRHGHCRRRAHPRLRRAHGGALRAWNRPEPRVLRLRHARLCRAGRRPAGVYVAPGLHARGWSQPARGAGGRAPRRRPRLAARLCRSPGVCPLHRRRGLWLGGPGGTRRHHGGCTPYLAVLLLRRHAARHNPHVHAHDEPAVARDTAQPRVFLRTPAVARQQVILAVFVALPRHRAHGCHRWRRMVAEAPGSSRLAGCGRARMEVHRAAPGQQGALGPHPPGGPRVLRTHAAGGGHGRMRIAAGSCRRRLHRGARGHPCAQGRHLLHRRGRGQGARPHGRPHERPRRHRSGGRRRCCSGRPGDPAQRHARCARSSADRRRQCRRHRGTSRPGTGACFPTRGHHVFLAAPVRARQRGGALLPHPHRRLGAARGRLLRHFPHRL